MIKTILVPATGSDTDEARLHIGFDGGPGLRRASYRSAGPQLKIRHRPARLAVGMCIARLTTSSSSPLPRSRGVPHLHNRATIRPRRRNCRLRKAGKRS